MPRNLFPRILWCVANSGFALLVTLFGSPAVLAQAENSNDVVAVINGRRITRQEIDASIVAQLLPLQQQIFALRESALENRATQILLEQEAQRRNLTIEQLTKELTGGVFEIPPEQVEREYRENARAFGAMSPLEAKERIRLDMVTQARMRNYRAALARLRGQARINLSLAGIEPTVMVNSAGASLGHKNAPVTIIEFSDFQCPYCRQSFGTLKQILQKYDGKVRLVFKYLPLEIHPQAFNAARAAYCAGEQEKFWQFHDALFGATELSDEVLRRAAQEMQLEEAKFTACMKAESSAAAVIRDVTEAKRIGIDGTPSYVINGKLYRGFLTLEKFSEVIERELERASQSTALLN